MERAKMESDVAGAILKSRTRESEILPEYFQTCIGIKSKNDK